MKRTPESNPEVNRETQANGIRFEIGYATQASSEHPERNEDRPIYWEGRQGLRAIGVCDGMGGHENGEEAAVIAQQEITRALAKHEQSMTHPSHVEGVVRDVLLGAHKAIVQEQSRRGQHEKSKMGTTATVLVFCPSNSTVSQEQKVWIGHVGDSRAYRFRDGQLEHLTLDQSAARKTLGDAEYFSVQRRMSVSVPDAEVEYYRLHGASLVQALGHRMPNPEVFAETYQDGDLYFVVSDGISDVLSSRAMCVTAVEHVGKPSAFIQALIRQADAVTGLKSKVDDRTGVAADTRQASVAEQPSLERRTPSHVQHPTSAIDADRMRVTRAKLGDASVLRREQADQVVSSSSRRISVGERLSVPGLRGAYEVIGFNTQTGDVKLVAITMGNRFDRWLLDASPVGKSIERTKQELVIANPTPDLQAITRMNTIASIGIFLMQFPQLKIGAAERSGKELGEQVLRTANFLDSIRLPDAYGIRRQVEKILRTDSKKK